MGTPLESIAELHYLSLAVERIERAQRQESRLQAAYAARYAFEEDNLPEAGPVVMPAAWVDLHLALEDHIHFFIVAATNAINAREALAHRGHQLPSFSQGDLVRHWRNVLEHWDDPARGRPLKAEARWQAISDESEPGLGTSGYGDELHDMSGINLPTLRSELEALRERIQRLRESEWDRVWLTRAQAAGELGLGLDDFDAISSSIISVDEPEVGRRWHRDWVEYRRDGGVGKPPSWSDRGY